MSIKREPVALNFYARDCNKERIEGYLKGFSLPVACGNIIAGIVPHAGWAYSGRIAARVFKSIHDQGLRDTFLLLGAIHNLPERNSVYSSGSWLTPLGEIEVDQDFAGVLLDNFQDELKDDSTAHLQEHSLEVQLPFIKYFFPLAKIVPIRIAADNRAASLGKKIADLMIKNKNKIAVIGTTDLTHYGDAYGFTPAGYGAKGLSWMRDNDARIVNLALEMKAEDIVAEAGMHCNACGSGALAATVAIARSLGASKGVLLEYTTSHDVSQEKDFYLGVGYAGIIFCK